MKTIFLAVLLCNPFAVAWKGAKRAATNAFYATANFYVNHIQPNKKAKP